MEKIKKLKKIFSREQIDGYIIPKNDEFFGEYVEKHNDRLNFITNFSGSFGISLVLKNKNYLFVDGRYTLQAISQSGKFFKVITLPNKMPNEIIKKKLIIGFDPKLFTKKNLKIFFNKTHLKFKALNNNLIDKIWKRKIKKNKTNFYRLPEQSVGNSYKLKINQVISNLKKKGADYQFITSGENCAWLLNIRGGDSKYTPIPNGYILINKNKDISFFCNLDKISSSFRNHFKEIEFFELNLLNRVISRIKDKKFILDQITCSIHFENIIKENNKILNFFDPIYTLKAIKKKNEIKNTKIAHIYDGASLTKYLFWLKKNFLKRKITEITASQKLYEFRKRNNKFEFLSFPTISGTGPNGAIIHYNATRKTNRTLRKGDIYLVDSGGQYKYGTTDVTRTISLGNSNQRIKNIYTRVLKGHIAVANFKIKKNTSGAKIDLVARKYLKQIGLDYKHGTGHGVGYFLNVHEGPHAISKNNKVKLREGMIVSNEPGYYEKNRFGIRIENLIYVKRVKNKKIFENLTMVPIDKELIDMNILREHEIKWINNYHKTVFNNLKNYMNKEEITELKKACSVI